MEKINDNNFYFEESERFFTGIKGESQPNSNTQDNENNGKNDLPFWVSQR